MLWFIVIYIVAAIIISILLYSKELKDLKNIWINNIS